MPPIVFLAVVGAGCYAGYKLFAKLIEQAQTPSKSDQERYRREREVARNLGELEWDEKTGVYRPKSSA